MFEPIEKLINRNIVDSTPARALLEQLDGKRFVVSAEDIGLGVLFEFSSDGVRLSRSDASEADATVTGSTFAFARLGIETSDKLFRSGVLKIYGDTDVAENVQQLLNHAWPDWEEELSRLVGDIPARQIGNVVRGVTNWARRAASTLARNTTEFFQEESRDLPTRHEANEFMSDVDKLRVDMERTEARLRRIEQELDKTATDGTPG